MMDERILAILKEVAYEHTDDCDGMHLECVFACGGERDYSAYTDYSRGNVDLIAHTAPCPTMLARAVLREMGLLLHVYRICYDGIDPHFRAGFSWLTEEELKAELASHYEQEYKLKVIELYWTFPHGWTDQETRKRLEHFETVQAFYTWKEQSMRSEDYEGEIDRKFREVMGREQESHVN